MAYNITLEGKNTKKALSLLKDVAIILDKNKTSYWLEGGTLLGVRRENRLLPWDNDVDLSIMTIGDEAEKKLTKLLKQSGLRVRIRRYEKDMLYCKKGNISIIKIRRKYLFGLLKGKVCLEIFVKYKLEDKAYWRIASKIKNVPFKLYSHLKKVKFEGYNYSIPEKTDEYLTYRYGDWKTQKKDYNPFTDDNALKDS